jgi:cytochrome oxidase Cu insertion factor (SCO1/SenC/PrrC family)
MNPMKEDRPVPKLYVTVGAVALAALLGWTTFYVTQNRAGDAFASCRSGNVAGGAIGGPFELVDEAGRTVTDAQVFTRPALVYFRRLPARQRPQCRGGRLSGRGRI